MNWNQLYYLFFLLPLIYSCEKSDLVPLTPGPGDEITAKLDVAEMQTALVDFASILFQKVVAEEDVDKNVIISPLSVAIALYMTYNASVGETREAMASALALKQISADTLNVTYRRLQTIMQPLNDSVRMHMANAVFWDEERVSPSDTFMQALNTAYDAEGFAADFRADPEGVRDLINDWVDNKTEGRIEKILEELDHREIMFLVNALYFIGDWASPFDVRQTFKDVFQLADGSQQDVEFMSQDNYLPALVGDDFSGVAHQFADTNYAMYCILPPSGQDLNTFIQSFDIGDFIKNRADDFVRQRIYLLLPKFEVNYKIKLNNVLKAMGMEIAFDKDRANLTRIGTVAYGNPYISRVEHKTFLKIDEKGAEGAAVTAVGIAIDSAPPVLRFDRPYMVMLVHIPSRTPIFLGKIEQPNPN